MAHSPSSTLEPGAELPSFSLPDLDGRTVTDRDFPDAQALVVAFICPHCPYVKHVREAFAQLAREYAARGVAAVGINPNDARAYPEDDLDGMKREASAAGYPFPYLRDDTQAVARAFGAACTPDFFVFDRHRRLAYRGAFDGSRPNSGVPVTGEDLRAALDAILAGHPSAPAGRPSIGCSIKWKPGNAPA